MNFWEGAMGRDGKGLGGWVVEIEVLENLRYDIFIQTNNKGNNWFSHETETAFYDDHWRITLSRQSGSLALGLIGCINL